ncbi:MAG TPA: ABC transporter ATP-binding protein [Acidimicrobiales bacterium]|nr:ABC transporter ATP-binding protein [Acidimicrobiales bacterium]
MTDTSIRDSSHSGTGSVLYELRRVTRDYSKGGVTIEALRGIDLDIIEGEMISLEGPSGSGKSTLLQLIGALDVPTSGKIRFAGRSLEHETDRVLTGIRAQEIGFVFQQFNLIPTLSAQENVAIAMVPSGHTRVQRMDLAAELLGQVGLGERLSHLPSRLSGGEQQRVAIARALANAPRVVIADEPTGNLDSTNAQEFMALLHRLHQESGVTVIIATHDEEVAVQTMRRVRLRDGSIISDSPT